VVEDPDIDELERILELLGDFEIGLRRLGDSALRCFTISLVRVSI
jgi:hypothetical protein